MILLCLHVTEFQFSVSETLQSGLLLAAEYLYIIVEESHCYIHVPNPWPRHHTTRPTL